VTGKKSREIALEPAQRRALAAVVLLVVVGTASAVGSVRDHFLGTTVGSKIAFTSFRNGNFHLYVMNADGTKQRWLTPARGQPPLSSPEWSPDGRRIAFVSGPGACILDIHRVHFVSERNVGTRDVDISVANADGSERRLLADSGARLRHQACPNCGGIGHVAWSPDGRKMLLIRFGPS
jgi:Tol biopolymer transport system component